MLELNKVHHGDCLDLMRLIPDKSIDLVLTDPPYNINLKPKRKKTESIANDNMEKEDFINFIDSYFKECKRILKDDTFMISFLGWTTIPEFRGVCDKYFTLKSMPIRVKNNFGIGYYTRPQYEPMLLYLNGKPPVLENPISDVIKVDKVHIPVHSCEKPTLLYELLIESFCKEGIVFEGFMGSGALGVACKKIGRDFIGIEIEKKYVEMANKRLATTSVGLFS